MVLAALLLFVVCCAQVSYAYSPGDPEFRAFWVDAWGAGVLNQSQVDTLLGVPGTGIKGRIRDANCNAVIVQVRRNCDANYPSSMGEPYMGGLSPSNFNSVQAIVNAAHDTTDGKQRVEVHAWIVTFRTSGGEVYDEHNDPPTGSLTNLDNYWPSRDNNGNEVADKAFDPGHPLALDYTVNVAMDLVNNFDIDGIHFDYIRFTANNQGYNPTSVARYNARYGLTGKPAPTNEQWKQWRRDQVTAVVRKVYAKTQASKPWVKVSGSFVTWNPSPAASTRNAFKGTRPYYDVYSDWDSWMEEGIVDMAVPMTYYDWAIRASDYTKWCNFEKDRKFNRHMYIGPGVYMNSLNNAIHELQMIRDASPSGNYAQGFSGYSYRVPFKGGNWNDFSPRLVSDVTNDGPVPIPEMPWKTSPTKGHISGTVTVRTTGAWADGATVTLTGPEDRTMVCDGTGFYAFIDLTPGTYTVTASKAGLPNSTRQVEVGIGSVTGNMYVTDFVLGGPIISNIVASQMTLGYESITWSTDVPSTTQVEYGPTQEYGMTTTLDPSMVTSHAAVLSGLTPNALYHYRVISTNPDGVSVSDDQTFVAIGPPVISNVGYTNLTNYGATITWDTNQPTTTQVEYGPTTSYGQMTTLNSNLVTSHSQIITGLPALTEYHYRVISTNVNGTDVSGDYTFTTSGQAIISNVQVSNIRSDGATITWDTNAPADSKVSYGLTTSYGSQVTDSNLVRSHSITLTGLNQLTTYHFRCNSVNPYGTYTTGDFVFTTIVAPTVSGVAVSNITPNSATFTWTTNQLTDSTVACGYVANSYDTQTNDPAMVTSHSVTVTGLTSATRYHYKVLSANSTGTGMSADAVFSTPAGPDEYVIDDSSAQCTRTGSPAWLANSSSGVGYLNTYKYVTNRASSATNTCTWTPNLIAGNYDIYVYYPAVAGATTNATYIVRGSGGNVTRYANQTINPYRWNKIATRIPMPAGTTSYVRLTNATGETSLTTTVLADAVKFVFTGITGPPAITDVTSSGLTSSTATIGWLTDQNSTSVVEYGITADYGSSVSDTAEVASHSINLTGLTPNTTYHYRVSSTSSTGTSYSEDYVFRTPAFLQIIDDPQAEYTGTWTVGSYNPTTAYNNTYRFAGVISGDPPNPTATATFTPSIPVAGAYDIYCHYNAGGNRTHAARFTITTAGGQETHTVDQTTNGSQWVLVASGVQLNPESGTVVLDNYAWDAGQVVISDGVKWTTSGVVADTAAPTIAFSPPSAPLTRSGPISYTLTYDDNVLVQGITLTAENVILNKTGDADGTVTVSGSGMTNRTVTISNITGNGTLSISITPGTAVDSSANMAGAAGPSTELIVDNAPPAIEISAPSVPLTATGPVTFTVTYDGAASVDLVANDITLEKVGTANGTVSVAGSGPVNRLVTISNITGDGELAISIGAGTAVDAAGNIAEAYGPSSGCSVDNSTVPTVTIGDPSATTTGGAPVSYMITYDSASEVTLSAGNITLNKTGTANGTVTVTGEGTTNRTVTIESISGTGTLGISLAAGTASSINGALAPAAGPSATFTVSDAVAVTVSLGAPSATVTATGPVSYTVTYGSATEITLAPANITLNKTGTADGTVSVTGAGNTTRTVTISGITGNGTLGISIAAGTAGAGAPAAGPSATFVADNTPADGVSIQPVGAYQDASLGGLSAQWTGADAESGIAGYEVAVGTNPPGVLTDAKDWTSVGLSASSLITFPSITEGETYYISVRATNGVGLTSTPVTSIAIPVAYRVSTVRQAKALPADARVHIVRGSCLVTAVFADCYYLEDRDRMSGLRVEYPTRSDLLVGQEVDVYGILGRNAHEERTLLLPSDYSTWPAWLDPVTSFILPTKSVAGSALGANPGMTGGIGLNNTGLLVKIAGKVTAGVGDGFYVNDGGYLNDGIGAGVKVWTGTSGVSRENTYVIVTGVVSLRKDGVTVHPQILARDIQTQ